MKVEDLFLIACPIEYLFGKTCQKVLKRPKMACFELELVSKELNHFGVIACLFRQIGVILVDLCYFALFEDFSLEK